MSSFAMEEFVGNGALSGLIPKFVAAGWDDVPTLKMINLEEMTFLKLTQHHIEAMELRTYLHDRSLMQYADRMEASSMRLPDLQRMDTVSLCSQFGMKRSHVSRFLVKETGARIQMPSPRPPPKERGNENEIESNKGVLHRLESHLKLNPNYDPSTAKAVLGLKLNEGHVFKGIVAARPANPRLCGCIKPAPIVDDVASHSSIANISVQKLAPEYKGGIHGYMERKSPPMKASELWNERATILLCIRRPGCIMCRAEAHQLYSRKPIFDALGFQLVAVLHEQIEPEVKDFWPRYWGGLIVVDQALGFFKALGGGKLMKENFLAGFVLNSRAMANFKTAKATGFDFNFKGEGDIKGGMFIVRSGKDGVAYQFIERNFGDWAPIAEVVDICTRIQNEKEEFGM